MSATADLIGDPATPDDALARAAASAPADELAPLLRDEARLLRHPAIVAALFANPQAPMAVVNRAVAICVRGGVRVEGIPAFDEVAAGVRAEAEGGAATGAFEAVLSESAAAAAADGPDADAHAHGPGADADADGKAPSEQGMGKGKRKAAVIDFGKLKLFEKIRLATLGNSFCRQTLLRDSNRLVAMAAIRSPGITEQEVIRAAGNRAVSEDVIRYIANNKDHVKNYPIKLALVGNAKCPLALSLRMLPHLRPEDLKHLARSKNVPNALSVAARKLAATRSAP
ncbi:MAG TPA: hypothetical protein VFH68_16465 [Polyangia bacterium]|jgi:hypothetical protein|nr:hypothetical protein [Polyangia bacterium]